jgi:hypothetical protein
VGPPLVGIGPFGGVRVRPGGPRLADLDAPAEVNGDDDAATRCGYANYTAGVPGLASRI